MKKQDRLKTFSQKIEAKERLKLKALQGNKRSPWSGLGLFGMVGWSIIVPTLGGVALGKWLDGKYPQSFSWTLSLLLLGLIMGCWVAWHWIKKEHKDMKVEQNRKI
jgi:ATP synthase protein I